MIIAMKNYIGVKSLEAKPMNLGDYNTYRGWPIPADEDPQRPGYLVRYADGYESWSPKEAFEAAYFHIDQANKLSPLDIDNFLGDKLDTLKIGEKSLLVSVKLPTGFVDHEVSSCVDPANFDERIGKQFALEKIRSRVWDRLGFVLQWARYGLRQS